MITYVIRIQSVVVAWLADPLSIQYIIYYNIHIIYRVSQEECVRLRESVP